MSTVAPLRSDPLEADQEDLREAVEVLVNRGEMEVVTAASGEILYILQAVDE